MKKNMSEAELKQLIEDIEEIMEAGQSGTKITFTHDDILKTFTLDGDQFEQLLNLLMSQVKGQ